MNENKFHYNFSSQAKRTKKVKIVRKYGTRYGASIRKQVKKLEESGRIKYFCNFCGKVCSSVILFLYTLIILSNILGRLLHDSILFRWNFREVGISIWRVVHFYSSKDSVRREAAGIRRCKPCCCRIAGAAYSLNSITANNAKSFIKRAKETQKDK